MSKKSVFMFLTRACNLMCSHCYVSATPSLKGNMTLEVFERTVNAFVSQGVDDFRLTGGEPMIHPQFDLFLSILSSQGLRPRLITNGLRLIRMRSPKAVLSRLSRCWISIYGISSSQHHAVGGAQSPPLEKVLEFAGRQTADGNWVGVSTLLTKVNLFILDDFLALAKKSGVRYLRFLFGEPSGRAAATGETFGRGDQIRNEGISILNHLRHSVSSNAFNLLSLNDPFDLDSKYESGSKSCMLFDRHMWSVSPEGAIYSCCFNIYDPAHLVQDIFTTNTQTAGEFAGVYSDRCKGLNVDWWPGRATATCPISAITLFDLK